VKNSIVHLENSLCDLHDPRLKGEGDGGVAGRELDLHQAPDAVGQLDGLVDHVLPLQRALGDSEGVVVIHLCLDAITGAFHVLDGELDLVGGGDVLPCVEESFLFHITVLAEEDVQRSDAGEVEDVDVVLDGDLDVGQRVHLLYGAAGVHGKTDVQNLPSVQQGDIERLGGGQTETVFVELDPESLHGLHCLIVEAHLHVDDIVLE